MINIYSLHHPVTGELRYVGKTIKHDVNQRLKEHVRDCFKFNYPSSCWIRSLKLNGLIPEITVLDSVEDYEWEFWEQFYIEYFRSLNCKLLNIEKGGLHFLSYKGKKLSKKHIFNINNSSKSENKKRPILQYSKQGIFIKEYKSALDAYNQTGIWKESIRNSMRGRSKSAGGYIWKYK